MKAKTFILLCLLTGIATASAYAQEWTKAQKEVLQVVEDSWFKYKSGDLEGFLVCFHEKYQGWSNESPLPSSKESIRKWFAENKDREKILFYEINPARITVLENAAVVDYYFWYESIYTSGEKKEYQEWYGKNAEFYVKENGKWLLIGDLTIYNKVKEEK